MRVLLLGATGYIGAVLAEHLSRGGHRVIALRRDGSRSPAPAHAAEVRTGDLTAPATLTAAVTADVDAVVHAGAPTADAARDAAAVEALLAPLHGTGRPFVYTSGVWVLGATGTAVADETTPTAPVALVRDRPGIERSVLAAAARGVRAVVLRPGVVHGRGGGIPALLVDLARAHGTGRYVGPGARWPMVHVDDLADLYLEVLRHGRAGTVLHAVAEQAVPSRDLARAAALAAGVAPGAQSWPLPQARAELGAAFADALALDQAVGSERTRVALDWHPHRLDAVSDLTRGSYAARDAA